MFEEKLERSGIHCAGGSSDLLDAARQTPDYATLEVLAKHIHMNRSTSAAISRSRSGKTSRIT